MNKKTKELADAISFRLLATKKHSDYEWLCNEIEKSKPSFKSIIKDYWNLCLDGYRPNKIGKITNYETTKGSNT
jgi:hypothetical protein|tara:strand:- start:876 stop:1097 length:222 start_codon:yes stop_codon:yes gene_type:complete